MIYFKLLISFFLIILYVKVNEACSNVIINELNYDEPGADTKDFIELYDSGKGSRSLDGLILVFFNGATNQPYMTANLTGYTTNANGYFLLGQPAVKPDLILSGQIQNGPDGIGLYCHPSAIVLSNNSLVDAIVYGTSGAQGLLDVLLPGQGLVHENNSVNDQSMSRCSCNTPLHNSCFQSALQSPSAKNACPNASPCSNVYINELNYDEPGSDSSDFLELYDSGIGNTPLEGLYLLFFNGATDQMYMKLNLTSYSTGTSGFFLIGQPAVKPDLALPQQIQNGPDGVGLYCKPSFLNLTSVGLVDAVVYGTSGDAQSLLDVLLPGQKLVHETNAPSDQSLSRCDCNRLLENSCFLSERPSPRSANFCPAVPSTTVVQTTLIATSMGPTTTPKLITTPPMCPNSIIINEVNAAPGKFAGSFIELYDGGAGNTPMMGFALLLFNSTSLSAYYHVLLSSHKTDSTGYFVIGQVGSHPNIVLPGNSPLATGVGAVGIYCSPSSFLLSNVSLVDAVIYNTGNASLNGQAQNLLSVLLPGQTVSMESPMPDTSASRCPNACNQRLNSSCFQQALPTSGAPNNCPAFCGQPILQGTFANVGSNFTAESLCAPNGNCVDGPFGAKCSCKQGYMGTFCKQLMTNRFTIHQRCALYSTNETTFQNIPNVCPLYTLCIPENHQCLFTRCNFPVGWCLPIS